jgi:hypothetical protein
MSSQEKLIEVGKLWSHLLQMEGVPKLIENAVSINMELMGQILLHCIPQGVLIVMLIDLNKRIIFHGFIL